MPIMEIGANSQQNLARKNSCTNANYIWAKSSWNGEAKNANHALVQATHKTKRAWKLFLLHQRRIMPSMEIRANSRQTLARNNSCTNEAVGMGRPKTQTLRLCNQHTKRYELGNCSSCHHPRIMPSMEIRANSRQNLGRSNSCTNANYIWAKSSGNWEAKNANSAFVQSTHKAVRAWKLFLLHHRRIMPSMEIRANSRQNLARNNSCTNANYIWAKSSWNGEAKNAIPAFVQSTHKAVRAWKLFLLHHRGIMPSMEIRANSRQTLARNNSCTNMS